MRSKAMILAVAVMAGYVSVDFIGSFPVLKLGLSQAFAGDKEAASALPEALKECGMVNGKVVSVDKDSIVIKLAFAMKKGTTAKVEEGVKDKEVVVVVKDVKDLPQLKAEDKVFAMVTQSEGQLVATKVHKMQDKTAPK